MELSVECGQLAQVFTALHDATGRIVWLTITQSVAQLSGAFSRSKFRGAGCEQMDH